MKEITFDDLAGFNPGRDLSRGHAARVLVVDDDETERCLTIWNLGKAWPVEGEMMVECAADGAEALQKIQNHRYTMVVLDWNMPEQDGLEVLETMRGNGWSIPVVVVSGQRREAIASHLQAMAATFVNKNELNPTRFRNAITASLQIENQ